MTEEFRAACSAIDEAGAGEIMTKGGEIVSGVFFAYESEWDDPEGIGWIALQGEDGAVIGVASNDFSCLLRVWVPVEIPE